MVTFLFHRSHFFLHVSSSYHQFCKIFISILCSIQPGCTAAVQTLFLEKENTQQLIDSSWHFYLIWVKLSVNVRVIQLIRMWDHTTLRAFKYSLPLLYCLSLYFLSVCSPSSLLISWLCFCIFSWVILNVELPSYSHIPVKWSTHGMEQRLHPTPSTLPRTLS